MSFMPYFPFNWVTFPRHIWWLLFSSVWHCEQVGSKMAFLCFDTSHDSQKSN